MHQEAQVYRKKQVEESSFIALFEILNNWQQANYQFFEDWLNELWYP